MNNKMVVADIKNVSKNFNFVQAVNKISAQITAGKLTGLVGPDGVGKTTLIRMLAGLLEPSEGDIAIIDISNNTIATKDTIADLVGYMPQRFGLYEDLSVLENMELYARLRGIEGKERENLFKELFTFTKLEPFKKRLAGNLSGGMKQKLGLACALMAKPKLLLLDEPGVGVDPVSRQDLWAMVKNLTDEGMAVVWATAYMDEAQRCESVILMNEGNILYQGVPEELMKMHHAKNFEDAFIELLGGIKIVNSEIAEKMPMIEVDETLAKHMVECTNLTKKFGDFTATDNVNFKVKKGEIFGLLGPNGAGKSTTFKMLCGLLSITGGNASVFGLELSHAKKKVKLKLGYMAQKFSRYGLLSVKQNLDFAAGVYGLSGKIKQERIKEMIDTFHLEPFLNLSPDDLSLGYKQRLALACALMHRPAVLFLDEPTSGVDPLTRREFWTHINAFAKKGMTIMVTTHFMDEAEYCDRIALMYNSKLIALDTPKNLKKSVAKKGEFPNMEEAFIRLVKKSDLNKEV